jgi:copper(I)-binding protein
LALGLLSAFAVAGCGAGPDAQTSQIVPAIAGVNADAAGILVRNAVVPFAPEGYPLGGVAPVELSIANSGEEPVRLVQLSSEGAGSGTVTSATPIGVPTPSPSGGTGATVEIVPGELVAVTLELTGLRQGLDGTASIPVTLTFDNGAELPLAVPMAPPLNPLPPATPVVPEEEH